MSATARDPELDARLARTAAEARQLLGPGAPNAADDGGADPVAQLPELIAGLQRLLAATPDSALAEHAAERAAGLERLRHRYQARFDALGRAHGAVGRLREITSPAAMLSRAPAALCEASQLRRAILSLVGGGRMTAEAASFTDDEPGARRVLQELSGTPIRLEHPLIETELLRRRRATIVVDAHVHPRVDPRMTALMGWRSYTAAPLAVAGHVIGVLHADRGPEGRLDVLDRDVLWEFATALAQAYESASLVRTLRGEREQMRQFLDWLSARSSELTDAPIRLATVQRPPRPPLAPHDAHTALEGRDDRVVFEGLLTRRELDVLRLLAEGRSNKSIAEALVISDGTVKFHVNSLLRKLRVANRAEAVARYLRLLGMQTP